MENQDDFWWSRLTSDTPSSSPNEEVDLPNEAVSVDSETEDLWGWAEDKAGGDDRPSMTESVEDIPLAEAEADGFSSDAPEVVDDEEETAEKEEPTEAEDDAEGGIVMSDTAVDFSYTQDEEEYDEPEEEPGDAGESKQKSHLLVDKITDRIPSADGEFLMKKLLPPILIVAATFFICTRIGYYSQGQIKDIDKLERKIKEVGTSEVIVNSQLTVWGQEHMVEDFLRESGLKLEKIDSTCFIVNPSPLKKRQK